MPDENSKAPKFADTKGGAMADSNPAKILNIYGNFPPAQMPGSKPPTK